MNLQSEAAASGGFTLAEMLVALSIVAILAVVSIPMLSSNEPAKLAQVAEQVVSVLRLAVSEARRTGKYVLVDGKTEAGNLSLYISTSTGQKPPTTGTSAILDPLTKRAVNVKPALSSMSSGVVLTPQFKGGGSPRLQLLIGPGANQFRAFDGVGNDWGSLQSASGVLLTLGAQSLIVSINESTGLVTRP